MLQKNLETRSLLEDAKAFCFVHQMLILLIHRAPLIDKSNLQNTGLMVNLEK
jgi:hypothetical protein